MSDTVVPDWLMHCADNFPGGRALQCGETSWTFAELERGVVSMALRLVTVGVGEGSRVAVLAANRAEYVTLVHALTRLGAILVPLNTRLTRQELCWQLRDVRADLLVCDGLYGSLAAEVGEDMPELARVALGAAGDNHKGLSLRGGASSVGVTSMSSFHSKIVSNSPCKKASRVPRRCTLPLEVFSIVPVLTRTTA
jgi:acyl-CoA synthetase (AMP-forming)/AMP-acid ligase II